MHLLSEACIVDSYCFIAASNADITIQNSIIDNIRIHSQLFITLTFNYTFVITNVTISRMDFYLHFILMRFYAIMNIEVHLEHATVWGFNRDCAYTKGYNWQLFPNTNKLLADVGFLEISGVSQVLLENCVLEGNIQLQEYAVSKGTVTIQGEFESLVLRSCIFHRGMHRLHLEWTATTGQTTTRPSVLISNCTFEADFAILQPYLGIYSAREVNVVLENSRFVNITTKFRTFFEINLLSDSTCLISNTIFLNNRAYLPDYSS